MSTPADLYYAPLRVVITIRDVSNDPTYLIHNSFAPPEPRSGSPSIFYCDVDLAYGQSGTFTIKINDPESQLDPTKIGLGNRVWIQAGRTPDKLFNLISGICETFQPIRGNFGLLGYVMTGMGTQQILNERVVNFLRSAQRRVGNPNKPFYDDPAMKANLLFKDLLERTDVIPTNHPAIKHTLYPGQFNTSELVDANVDTFIASLTEPYVEASQVANSIADMAGAIWGVEAGAPNEPDKVFLRFPSTSHSGILIKDKPEDRNEYTAKNVSYVRAAQGGWSYTDSRRKEDGFTNKIFSKTGADQVSGTASEGADNFTAVNSVEIAQQFIVNSTQFRDIAVTVSIEGVGEQTPLGSISSWNPKSSAFSIVNDDNGRPGPIKEADISFPLGLKNGEVKPIFLQLPQTHSLKTLRPGDKAWLIMFQEGVVQWSTSLGNHEPGACGKAYPDFALRWHHDGGTSGTSALRTVCNPLNASETGNAGQIPPKSDTTTGWVVNYAGPTYSYLFFDSFSHIVEASDQDSINKYGEVDSFIDATWISDEDTMSQFLASVLQYAAKPRRIYEMTEVFIPYSSILMPGQLVTVVDTKAGFSPEKNTVAEVQEVRYEFSAESPGKDPLGAHTCEIRLLGYVDYKEQFILIHQPDIISLPPPPPGSGPPGQLPTTYIQYFGGPFMNILSPSIHLIFWGTAWNSGAPATLKATMQTQIQSIIDSVYFTELSQYGNIKAPNYGGSVVHTATPTSIIGTDGYTTENLRTVVNAAMSAGQVPNADSFKGPTKGNIAGFDYNHIYVVFVPPGFLLQNVPGDPIFIGSGIQSFKRTGTAANAAYSVVGITHAPTRFPTYTLTQQQQVMTATFTHEVVPALSSPRAVLTPINNESAYNFKMSGLPSGFFPGDTLVKDNHQSSNLLGTDIKVACYWSDRNGT